MRLIKLLILEDDLETISKILEELAKLENKLVNEKGIEISTIVLSESPQVENLVNKNPTLNFDVILLDRDCKIGGSFHNLDIQRFGTNKIIGISSVPEYNEELVRQGVTKIVHKDYKNLNDFAKKVGLYIEQMLFEN
jgi:hypothetical protein